MEAVWQVDFLTKKGLIYHIIYQDFVGTYLLKKPLLLALCHFGFFMCAFFMSIYFCYFR